MVDRSRRLEQYAALLNGRDGIRSTSSNPAVPTGRRWCRSPPMGMVFQSPEAAQQAFRDEFGRDPGPSDPLVFDPDEDEPVALTPETMAARLREAAERRPGPEAKSHMLAYADLGDIITEGNQHTFTAHEVKAYLWSRWRTTSEPWRAERRGRGR